jgi:hypothetical protein
MNRTVLSAITVAKFPGVSQASGAASAGTTLPNCSSGEAPRYVRVSATVAAWYRQGSGAQTAVAGDLMIQPGDPVILQVPSGVNQFAVIQVAAGGFVGVIALENM